MDNFDLRKYLTENKLTGNSKLISEIKIERDFNDPTGRRHSPYAILLKDISGEQLTSFREFMEYVEEYYYNPSTFGIDEDSDYYRALMYAYDYGKKAFKEYTEYWEALKEDMTEVRNIDEIVIEPEGPSGRFTREGNNMLRNIPDGFHTVVVGPKYVDAVTYSTYYDEPTQWAEDREELAPGSKIVYEGDDYYEALKIYNKLAD